MTPPADPSPSSATVYQLPAKPTTPQFSLCPGDAIEDLPPLEWRIKDVLPASGLAALYGPSGSGKSFLALDMAAAIADGGSWFGHIVKPAPVVYVALEGERGFPKRIKAWKKHNARTCPPDLYFVLDPLKLTNMHEVIELGSICPKGCVLIIDTLNRASPFVDENSSKDMSNVLNACKRLIHITQGLVLLIHHTGKDETRGLRGHSSLLAALDASIEVSRSIDQRAWCVNKSKDDSDELWHAFKLVIEQVGVDEDDDPITSCAVEPVGDVKTCAPAMPQGKVQKTILGPIQQLLATSGQDGNPGVPDRIRSISLVSAIQCAAELLTEIEPRRRATRAREAIEGMVRRGVLNSTTEFLWSP